MVKSLVTLFSLVTVLISFPALAHKTPGDNYDGTGKLYGVNTDSRNQGEEPNNCRQQRSAGDPVNAASGEFIETITDLDILGRMPLQISRTYRSQRQHHSSAFGANWFFIYDYHLRKLQDGNLLFTAPSGEEILFIDQGDGRYQPVGGDVSVITENTDGTYTLKPRGFRSYLFDSQGNLIRLAESSGDAPHFTYGDQKKPVFGPFRYAVGETRDGIIASRHRLVEIRDDADRFIRLDYYDDPPTGGRVKSTTFMADTADAVQVGYAYDENGNLIAVTGPATKQHPQGTTTRYSYSAKQLAPQLNHNLLTITAPNQVASGGEPYLVNRYDAFDRVVEQQLGQGTYRFAYSEIDGQPTTTVTARDGTVTTTTFNEQGNTLRYVIKGRKLRPDDPAEYVFRYAYDPETGNRTKIIYPGGGVVAYRYDARNNIIEIRRKEQDGPDSNRDMVSRFTHEPRFDRVKTYTDPLGRVTTYDYDYEEAERGDLNGDGVTNQANGKRIRTTEPAPQPGAPSPVKLYRFNDHGQLIEHTDPLGRINRLTYFQDGPSASRTQRSINDVNGVAATTSLAYDALGNIIAVTDPNGKRSRFVVNARGLIERAVNAADTQDAVDYVYDANGNLVRMDIENKDENGRADPANPTITFVFEYDLLDNMVAEKVEIGKVDAEMVTAAAQTDDHVLVTRMAYDVEDRLQEVIHAGGERERYQYDERGLILSRILAPDTSQASITHYTYSRDGYVSRITDPNGHALRLEYDGFNRLRRQIDPMGVSLIDSFDLGGRLIKTVVREPDGKLLSRVDREYDALDRPIAEHRHFFGPDGKRLQDGPLTPGDGRASSIRDYDIAGNLIGFTDDNGQRYAFTYDGLNRLTAETDPIGNRTEYTYDAADNLLSSVERDKDPQGGPDLLTTYRFDYDALNRLVRDTDPLDNTTEYRYDARSNLVFIKDADSIGQRLIYDSLSRLIQVEQELREDDGTLIRAIEERYRYFGRERLAAITDDNGHTTTFDYNALGLIEMVRYADQSVLNMTYDGFGNLIERRDARGISLSYSYYPNDLLRSIRSGETVESFTYDGLGRMRAAQVIENGEVRSTLTWKYDSLNRPVETTQDGLALTRRFDGKGNRLALGFADGVTFASSYDQQDRLQSIQRGNRQIAQFAYIGKKRLTSRAFSNRTRLSIEYDQAQRIARYAHSKDDTVFDGHTYSYDALSRVQTRTSLANPGSDPGAEDRFRYDGAGRLTAARYGVTAANPDGRKSLAFELDGVGNRIAQISGGERIAFNRDENGQYRPDPVNRYVKIGDTAQEYDAVGNLISDGRLRYEYDHHSRLAAVRRADTGDLVARYSYDALDRRIAKQNVAGELTRYLHDGLQVVGEFDQDNKLIARYIHGERIDEILEMERDGQVFVYHRDALGNVSSLTNAAGELVERYDYGPFGAMIVRDGAGRILDSGAETGNPYFFQARRFEPESGLYDFRARMYDPAAGRFLQRDPLSFADGLNLYQYAAGDPINRIDPLGRLSWKRFQRGVSSFSDYTSRTLRAARREAAAWGEALTYLPSEVASSFMDGRANDSLEGFVYNYGGKYLGMRNSPTYGHNREFNNGKKVADVTKELQKAVIISSVTGGAGNLMKGAKIMQVCTKGGRILRYPTFKAIDAAADTLTEFIMDENGNCWTAQEFLKRFGTNALYSVMGDAAAGIIAKAKGGSFVEGAEKFATGKNACSFTAGTPVSTADGLKPIESIDLGDQVWAMDPERGEIALREVYQVYRRPVGPVYLLDVEGEVIETTKEHPFWVAGEGWIRAEELEIGDGLLARAGQHLRLQDTNVSQESHMVYNLKVNEFHSYFISDSELLVHNCPEKTPNPKTPKDPKGLIGKDFEDYLEKTLGIVSKLPFKRVDKFTLFQDISRAISPRKSHNNNRLAALNGSKQSVKSVNLKLGFVRRSQTLGGKGSFKQGGREFDGAVGNRWYEAKSGRYWEDHAQVGRGFDKFKSDIGARRAIAKQHGATYEVHSNTPIPSHVKDWLSKKGIPFTEH